MSQETVRRPDGSASKDDKAETSQALFCALADYCGSNEVDKWLSPQKVKTKGSGFETYSEFKNKWNEHFGKKNASIKEIFEERVLSGKATYKQIDEFLTEKTDWYISSVLISNALIKDTTHLGKIHGKIKGIGWKSIFYEQKNITMNNIEILFKQANDKQKKNVDEKTKKTFIPFGDINKWCPADIYFTSEKAEKNILSLTSGKKFKDITFFQLNDILGKLIDDGELLPLSLKKQTSNVTIKKVNFNKSEDWKEIEKIGGGKVLWKKYPTNLTNLPSNPPARDMKIFLTNTNSEDDKIVLRHDSSTAVFKGEIVLKGMEARGGSLGLEQITSIISLIDESIANKIKSAYDKGNRSFKISKKPIREKYENAVKAAGLNIKSQIPKDKQLIGKIRKDLKYDDLVGQLSAVYVTNPIFSILKTFLDDDDCKSNFIRMVYAYSSSQSFESAKFVVAK